MVKIACATIALLFVGCGQKAPSSQPKIANGDDVAADHWIAKSTVAFFYKRNGVANQFCSGTLIDDDVVLTAAHCNVIPASETFVHFGPSGIGDNIHQMRSVLSFENHNDWTGQAVYGDDIAVVKLTSSAPEGYEPMTIANVNAPIVVDDEAVIAGFGTVNNFDQNVRLRSADATIEGFNVDRKLIDANGKGESNTCKGDSGGPLYVRINGEILLAGITSYGGNCVISQQSWYTDVRKFVPWLLSLGL